MSDDDAARLREDLLALTSHNARRDEILQGSLPSTIELHCGLPFMSGSFRTDVTTWSKSVLLNRSLSRNMREHLELVQATPTADTLRAAIDAGAGAEILKRLQLYAAWAGDKPAKLRLVRELLNDSYHDYLPKAANAGALALGLLASFRFQSGDDQPNAAAVDDTLRHGHLLMRQIAGLVEGRWIPAESRLAAAAGDLTAFADILNIVDQDDSGIDDGIPDEFTGNPPELEEPGAVVVPPLDASKATSNSRDIIKSWKGISGERLPIAQVRDLAASAARLVARTPWASEIIYTMLADLEHGGDVVFRHTCLVGPPGTGKSEFLYTVATEFGLPTEEYSLAGSSDSSQMGTSSRFQSTEESNVLRLIKREAMATVCVLWDELEKVSEGRQNGSALDALLPFLVPHQAKRLRDPCLNVPVDLSYVSHFATANSLKDVPAPLKDRMRILRMPSPGWQHIGLLSEQILDGIAKRRNRRREFYPPLAQDEVDLIKGKWAGGSIRRLERYIEIIVAGRDAHQQFGRA